MPSLNSVIGDRRLLFLVAVCVLSFCIATYAARFSQGQQYRNIETKTTIESTATPSRIVNNVAFFIGVATFFVVGHRLRTLGVFRGPPPLRQRRRIFVVWIAMLFAVVLLALLFSPAGKVSSKPNQSTDPTLSSVTPAAGQPARHP
jgi:heme/copper-type cytochrome/quinol oxidase subunit 2